MQTIHKHQKTLFFDTMGCNWVRTPTEENSSKFWKYVTCKRCLKNKERNDKLMGRD
jgi:hypothetical protein